MNLPDPFLNAVEQKWRSRLRSKRYSLGVRVGDEGTSSQTPLDNVESVLDVFREAVCEFRAGSDAAAREKKGGARPQPG